MMKPGISTARKEMLPVMLVCRFDPQRHLTYVRKIKIGKESLIRGNNITDRNDNEGDRSATFRIRRT
jgi:hypothetical protein